MPHCHAVTAKGNELCSQVCLVMEYAECGSLYNRKSFKFLVITITV